MSELEKHMTPITLEEALKVYDEQPTEVKADDVKPLPIDEAIKLVKSE